MTLKIILDQSELSLQLIENRSAIDIEKAKYYHDLSVVLISSLDSLLKRNNIDIKRLKSYKMLSNLGAESTSHKIVSALIRGLQVSR